MGQKRSREQFLFELATVRYCIDVLPEFRALLRLLIFPSCFDDLSEFYADVRVKTVSSL
jgi:hypothetical protein